MAKLKILFLVVTICALLIVAGYIGSNWNTAVNDTPPEDNTGDDGTIDDATDAATDDVPTTEDTNPTPDGSTTIDNTPDYTDTADDPPFTDVSTNNFTATTLAEALADNQNDHEDYQDYTWDSSNVVNVTLNEDSISVDGTGTEITGTTLTIKSAGTYSISGTLNDGQIIVDTNNEFVRLILNGVNIASATKPPLHVVSADKTVIVLADNTENYLTDNVNNVENGALFSRDDLTIYGSGTLTVNGNHNDAIHCNDGLIIRSGTIKLTSVDDAICGKDYIVIKGGNITANSVGDSLISDNTEEEDRGYVYIEDGTVTVTSSMGDAITAQTDLLISGGTFTLTSGGGGFVAPDDNVSTKGLKAGMSIFVDNGVFTISSSDDAVHSNYVMIINGGTFDIATGDDGFHSEKLLEINDGTFNISRSFEGLESEVITINNGHFEIYSSDDAINVVEAYTNPPPGGFGMGDDAVSENCFLYINGGFLVVDSGADGIDSNGYVEMNDGVLIINGPFGGPRPEAAIDYGQGSFKITGGTLVAVGSKVMLQGPGSLSTQNSVIVAFNSSYSPGTLVNFQTTSGQEVLTFSPAKRYESIVFSSPELANGSYDIFLGGSSTGTSSYGIYEGGTYSGGTKYTSFTISEVVTTIGRATWPFGPP